MAITDTTICSIEEIFTRVEGTILPSAVIDCRSGVVSSTGFNGLPNVDFPSDVTRGDSEETKLEDLAREYIAPSELGPPTNGTAQRCLVFSHGSEGVTGCSAQNFQVRPELDIQGAGARNVSSSPCLGIAMQLADPSLINRRTR